MEKAYILMIILGLVLILMCTADYVLDRIIVSRRKRFAAEIGEDIEDIEQKIAEIQEKIEIGEATLFGLPEEQKIKCLAEFGRLRINLSNLQKNCDRIRRSVETEEVYAVKRQTNVV